MDSILGASADLEQGLDGIPAVPATRADRLVSELLCPHPSEGKSAHLQGSQGAAI